MPARRYHLAVASVWLALLAPQVTAQPAPRIEYGKAAVAGNLTSGAIDESSGLAASHRNPGVLWTCNDSGDKSRIFAIDTSGKHLATVRIKGKNVDWEDMASFAIDGRSFLLIADVGNNAAPRDDHEIYIVEEPLVATADGPAIEEPLVPLRVLEFTYEDGRHDCEAVAVCVRDRKILLVTKVWGIACGVYELPLETTGEDAKTPLVAKRIAGISLTPVTAMDVSPDGLRAVLLGYGNAFEYQRAPDETWATAFARRPRTLRMPRRKQGEAICFGADGETLYLTSEGRGSPLHVISPKKRDR